MPSYTSPLTTDLVSTPAHWRLGLLVGAAGLHVVATAVVGDHPLIVAYIPFDAAAESPIAAFEEAVYANPFLLLPFRSVTVQVATDRFFIAPTDALGRPADLARLLGFDTDSADVCSSGLDGRNHALWLADRQLMRFIARTYPSAKVVHPLATLATFFSRKSRLGNSTKIYIDLTAADMTVLIYNSTGLAFAATYPAGQIDDAVYYILAAANTAGCDTSADEFLISGDPERRSALLPRLRNFANYVMPVIFPSAAYNSDPAALKAPFSLIIDHLCE